MDIRFRFRHWRNKLFTLYNLFHSNKCFFIFGLCTCSKVHMILILRWFPRLPTIAMQILCLSSQKLWSFFQMESGDRRFWGWLEPMSQTSVFRPQSAPELALLSTTQTHEFLENEKRSQNSFLHFVFFVHLQTIFLLLKFSFKVVFIWLYLHSVIFFPTCGALVCIRLIWWWLCEFVNSNEHQLQPIFGFSLSIRVKKCAPKLVVKMDLLCSELSKAPQNERTKSNARPCHLLHWSSIETNTRMEKNQMVEDNKTVKRFSYSFFLHFITFKHWIRRGKAPNWTEYINSECNKQRKKIFEFE